MRKTISCFTLRVPSEGTTVQAVGRKRGLQGTSLYRCRWVWELDKGAVEASQDTRKCLHSQGVERWKNSCLGFLLDILLRGRQTQAGCSEAPVARLVC